MPDGWEENKKIERKEHFEREKKAISEKAKSVHTLMMMMFDEWKIKMKEELNVSRIHLLYHIKLYVYIRVISRVCCASPLSEKRQHMYMKWEYDSFVSPIDIITIKQTQKYVKRERERGQAKEKSHQIR